MTYFTDGKHIFCSHKPDMPFDFCHTLPEEGEILFLFRRPPLTGRETFAVSDTGVMTAIQDEALLSTLARPELSVPPDLARAVAQGRVRGVNLCHPQFESLLEPPTRPPKFRLHLLAPEDMDTPLLRELCLLGGDILSSIGICAPRPEAAKRWEEDLKRIALPRDCDTMQREEEVSRIAHPLDYDSTQREEELSRIAHPRNCDAIPPVEIIDEDHFFACDVCLFCTSRHTPDASDKTGDARMASFAANAPLVTSWARMAREKGFKGHFWVAGHSADLLCKAALMASNRDETGAPDYRGLLPHQIRGFGPEDLTARAVCCAEKEPRFASFLTDGRTFCPHGEDLIAANSIADYDDTLSQELTDKLSHTAPGTQTPDADPGTQTPDAHPCADPALRSDALSILSALRGRWHCSSVFMGGVFMGCQNREAPNGTEIERLPLPEPLMDRIRAAADRLRAMKI